MGGILTTWPDEAAQKGALWPVDNCVDIPGKNGVPSLQRLVQKSSEWIKSTIELRVIPFFQELRIAHGP
jgi:hypothetical protein